MRITFPRKAVIVMLMTAASLAFLSADERTESWSLVYSSAQSDIQRLAIMNQIVEFQDRGFTPLMQNALNDLFMGQIEKGESTQVKNKISLAILLIRELGNLRATDAGSLLNAVYNDVKDPFVRSEAVISLGKIRANEYVPVFSRDLSDLNLSPPKGNDAHNQEVLAYGLVSALGLMKDIRAYESVFGATYAWYSVSSKVKTLSRTVLESMTDDPTEPVLDLLVKLSRYEDKQTALELELASKADVDKKNLVARTALTESMRTNETDAMQKTSKYQLAMAAMNALEANKDTSQDSVALFRKIIQEKPSQDILLTTYRVAGSNPSDDSARFLSEALLNYNTQQKRGVNGESERQIIRQIVAAIAKQKNKLTKDALLQAEFANHDNIVVREVKAALAAF